MNFLCQGFRKLLSETDRQTYIHTYIPGVSPLAVVVWPEGPRARVRFLGIGQSAPSLPARGSGGAL